LEASIAGTDLEVSMAGTMPGGIPGVELALESVVSAADLVLLITVHLPGVIIIIT